MEEAAEVVQGASKCLRFGTAHEWPAHERSAESRLLQELIDLRAIVQMCQDEDILGLWPGDLPDRLAAKKEKVEKYLLISQELGKLS